MVRFAKFAFLLVATLTLAACASGPQAPPTQAIVNGAQETVEALKKQPFSPDFADALKDAQGIAIFPGLYKAGFFVGAEGGNGVVLARDAQGNWGYPAFYTLGSGSLGFQIGAQRARTALVIRRSGAIQAIVEHQAKLGADVSIALAHMGAGLEGSTTSNLGPDILAFNDAMGLYGGITLEGGALIRRNDYNQEYYGQPTAPGDVLLKAQRSNPGADALRAALVVP